MGCRSEGERGGLVVVVVVVVSMACRVVCNWRGGVWLIDGDVTELVEGKGNGPKKVKKI